MKRVRHTSELEAAELKNPMYGVPNFRRNLCDLGYCSSNAKNLMRIRKRKASVWFGIEEPREANGDGNKVLIKLDDDVAQEEGR